MGEGSSLGSGDQQGADGPASQERKACSKNIHGLLVGDELDISLDLVLHQLGVR